MQYAILNAGDITTSNDIAGNTNSDYGKTDRVNAIAGNDRVTAMQHAYQNGKAQRYRAEFEEDGMHGIDPAVIKLMAHPVLVRVMPDNEISSGIGDRTNTLSTLRMNPIETARNDMNRIDLSGIRFNEDGSPSMDSVSDFVRGLPEQERAQLISPNGQPTVQAIYRLYNAIFQKV